MKSAILLALVGAVCVCAQSVVHVAGPIPTGIIPNDAPGCVKVCGQGMWDQVVAEFHCAVGDFKCACFNDKGPVNASFVWGFWDCSRRTCNDLSDADKGAQQGVSICSSVGLSTSLPPVTLLLTNNPGAPATTPTAPAGTDATLTPSAVATSTFTTVVTPADGTPVSSTVTTTISGNGAPTSAAGGTATAPTGSGTSVVATGTTVVSTDSANTASASESSTAATTTSSSGLGSQATAAPIAGFLAAAGLVAALL